MVPFGVPIIIRHLLFRVPKRDHNIDNHPNVITSLAFRYGSIVGRVHGARVVRLEVLHTACECQAYAIHH